MTLAICITCGHEKVGAFTTCGECGFEPTDPVDRAKSIALSDANMSTQELRAIGEQIKSGVDPSFDAESIAATAAQLQRAPGNEVPLGCRIAVWIPVAVMVGLLGFVAVLYGWCLR